MTREVLTIDIGGTNVKMRVASDPEKRSFPSGPDLTPDQMVDGVMTATEGWSFDRISIGIPAPIVNNQLARDPVNLGPGWTGFDFDARLRVKVKLLNDAAMQAVGSYEGGKMLFLGLGTGLGTCMIASHFILPMELAHMPFKRGRTFDQTLGVRGLKRRGKRRWTSDVLEAVEIFQRALLPDSIVLGGGNCAKLKNVPEGCTLGSNANAFLGGFRLWEPEWAASIPVYDR